MHNPVAAKRYEPQVDICRNRCLTLKAYCTFIHNTDSPPMYLIMAATIKNLRPYQARLVTDMCRHRGDILVEQPTGSGKTLAVVTLIGMQLGRRFSHAVIAAPQEHIQHGFV